LLFDYKQDTTEKIEELNLATYVNITSAGALPSYTAIALQEIVRYTLGKSDTVLEFIDVPLKQNVQVAITQTSTFV